MPMYRATFFFKNTSGYGWTETLFNTIGNISDALAAAVRLQNKRIVMLGTDVTLPYVRVSDDLIKRDSLIYQVPPGARANPTAHVSTSDIANTCLTCRMEADSLHRRIMYIRGQEDDCVTEGGQYTPTPNFVRGFGDWSNALYNDNWAIKAKSGTALPVTITGAVQALPSGMVTVTTAAAHGLLPNDSVLISNCVGATQLNGDWRVTDVIDPTNFKVKLNLIMGTYFGGGTATARAFALYPITNAFIRFASHRVTGRPFDLHRGRRRVVRRT